MCFGQHTCRDVVKEIHRQFQHVTKRAGRDTNVDLAGREQQQVTSHESEDGIKYERDANADGQHLQR